MPVLARTLEKHGLPTVVITMMPFWAEKKGAPRTLAVEFPFGNTLGQAGATDQQISVIKQALAVLAEADAGGYRQDFAGRWPIPPKQAMKAWQPAEPSPIIAVMAPQLREMLRKRRKK